SHGVPIAGAIVNKVELAAQPGIEQVLERGLALNGIRLLGVLPVRPILSNPTLGMILDGVHGETIHPGPDLDRVIDGVAIGAMEPGHMLERVGPGTLVIVPGDREDVILTVTTAHLAPRVRLVNATEAAKIAAIAAEATNERAASVDGHEGAAIGLVLTGGYRPREPVLRAIRQAVASFELLERRCVRARDVLGLRERLPGELGGDGAPDRSGGALAPLPGSPTRQEGPPEHRRRRPFGGRQAGVPRRKGEAVRL